MNTGKALALANTIAFAIVIAVNIMANAVPINGLTTGDVSNLYPSLFTPAGITFSIWSVIYLLLIGFVVIQWSLTEATYFTSLSKWFIASCVLNVSWIFVWHYLLTAVSVLLMVLFLVVLIRCFLIVDRAVLFRTWEKILVRLPFTIYLSWICVATIANISAWLVSLEWQGGMLQPQTWTVIMMGIAAALAIIILWRFKAFAFPLVTIWALTGIALKELDGIFLPAIVLIGIIVLVELYVFARRRDRIEGNSSVR